MSEKYAKFSDKIEDYKIFSILGKGGFATVYKAKCLRTNIEVAIKVIDKKIMQNPGMIDRVRQEVSIHSRLKHPAILELYTFFEDTEYVYIVLELASNGELQKYLKDNHIVMTETEVSNIMKQVVAGLIYLHSHQILHRDMTLSNLLLSDDMTIKIADFGLAIQLTKPDERHVTMCGTPNYISPEIASRASHGPPADVWSIGCMLYTLLIGVPPFDTDAIKSTLTKIVMSEVKYPAWLSMDAKDLIDKLLKKNPSDRIKLESILTHPFMNKTVKPILSSTNLNTMSSLDSGFLTMTTNASKESYMNSTPLRFGDAICSKNRENSPINFLKDNFQKNYSDVISNFNCNVKDEGINLISRQLSAQSIENDKNFMKSNNQQASYGNPKSFERDSNWNSNPIGFQQSPISSLMQRDNQLQKIVTEKIPVPPLNTKRLLPTRHKTKTAVMSISDSGEVVIEFIKFRPRHGEVRVTDVCRISSDGLRVVLYQPDNGRGVPVRDIPPDIPNIGVDSIFSYENLPQKYWKKYMYASRFIQLVKTKTPKVTYYSIYAKCLLMETLQDFEMFFYDGGKIIKSENDGVNVLNINPENNRANMMEHYHLCFQHCLNIEKSLEQLQTDNNTCFPVIIGKKPRTTVNVRQMKMNDNSNFSTPKAMSFSNSISTSLKPTLNVKSSTPINFNGNELANQLNIPDIVTLNHHFSGTIEIKYKDENILTFTPNKEHQGYTYTRNGFTKQYSYYDEVPQIIKDRVSYIPMILKLLSTQNTTNFKLNDNNVRCIR